VPCFERTRPISPVEAPGAPEEEPAEVPAVPSKSLAVEEVRNPSRSRRSREALGGALEPMQVHTLARGAPDVIDWTRLPDTYFDCEVGESPALEDDSVAQHFRYEFESGAIYDGEWLEGNRHGVGKQIWPDGTEYLGQWRMGRAHGLGHIKHSDGDSYSGEWFNGRAHGLGIYRFQDGAACYEGQFRCDHRDGLGVETWTDGIHAEPDRREELHVLWNNLAPPALNLSDASAIREYCDQKLDHFDEKVKNTWCQRFLVNATYHKEGGPVFICIDGEDYPWLSGGRPYTVACNNMVELAPKFDAMMMALEHRYYGGAAFDGVQNFSTANLKWHSSRQALADLAQFHDHMTKSLGKVPWVVFGGSYPGSLSAWARKLYPGKFAASVASSAPLLAQANFVGYNDVVASALTAPSVGGTPECLATYSKGHAEAAEMMKTPMGRRALEKMFNLCGYNPLDNSDNIAYWAGTDGIVSTVPQYNKATCEYTYCNVKLFCGNLSMMSKSTASNIETLQLMSEFQRAESIARGRKVPNCTDASYKAYVESMTLEKKVPGTDPKAGDQFGRLWTYQTCTEFGWYQTCEEGTNCPYTKGYNTIQWALELCQLLFDISPAQVLANIDATNRYYGGSNFPDATKVVFPNGEVDPWHWESNLVSPEPNVDTIFVKGASHCEWMHPEVPGMPMQLILAKEAIQRRIAAWLLESKEVEPKKEEEVKVEKAPKPEPVVQPRPEKSEEHSHKQHLQQQHAERKRKMSKFLLQTEFLGFAGGFQQGQKSGYGSNTWPDGTVYLGSWRQNCPNGPGEYSLNGGTNFKGQWEKSAPHGMGRYRWPDGKTYCGKYRFDQKDGFGILTEANGTVHEGFWSNGQLLE
ncbi:Thymus-specific serine protease (Serine protease 16), partial [Durusdinium trenchii]